MRGWGGRGGAGRGSSVRKARGGGNSLGHMLEGDSLKHQAREQDPVL